jgi:tRNA-uridine 2-sulfurtransferase
VTPRGGVITSQEGRVLGRHDGIHRFTVGQRKGLRLSSSEPLYVLAVDPIEQTVTVGPRAALDRTTLAASHVRWIAGASPDGPVRAYVQIRHRHAPGAARVSALPGGRAHVQFDEPQRAISPGQAAVFYAGDEVIGGGWIDRP